MEAREGQLTKAFVSLADTLVDDYDLVELLHRLVDDCVTLLDVAAAGLLLIDQRGTLQVMASSSERTRLLELLQLEGGQGPCLDCVKTGEPVLVPDLAAERDRWPRFADEAATQGFRSVHAVPMRLRAETIGALNLFGDRPGRLKDDDVHVAQALADVATIGILQHRAVARSEALSSQLQIALNSRIIIEQAKGVVAEREAVDVDAAFARLREYARTNNRALLDVARDVVGGELDLRTSRIDKPA